MSLRPEEVAGTLDERVLIAPDEVLENDRSSVVTGMVIARAWRDPGYRSRLLSSPREVLIEEGLEIPDGMAIRAFADTPAVRHIHLTSLTTEAEELVPVFREMLPLPAGSEIRLIQNTEQALCLVVPLAPPEPESLTDTDVLRRLAPRASAFAAGDVIATVVSDAFMEAAGEAAAAVNTTQTETASATAFVQESGEVVTTTQSQGWTMSVVTTPGVESATESMATSEAAADTSVSTQTDVVTLTNTYTTTDVSTTSWESTSNVTTQTTTAETTVTAVEAEAAATTTTVVAEGEAAVVVVAVGAAVLT
jgi:hypothetical protein